MSAALDLPQDLRRAVSGTLLPGFVGPALPDWVAARLDDGLAGVCLFGTNVESLEQVQRLTRDIRALAPDAVVAIDEEGGDVTRLFYAEGSPFPGNAVLGRLDDLALTRAVGREVGLLLAASGVSLDLAPDADINSDERNPVIGVRSFGADPELVARHTAAWTEGLQSTGVAATAKHFPGHGDTSADSHRALPVVDLPLETLLRRELLPFAAAVRAGTRAVMSAHILLPQLDPDRPATMSPRVLGLLRDELGFEGAIVSDALDMAGASGAIGIPAAAVRALAAGCDLLCIGTDTGADELDAITDAIASAVRDGVLPEERVREAAARAALLGSPAAVEQPGGAAVGPERIADAFSRAPLPDIAGARVIALQADRNEAIGTVPWGLEAAGVPVEVVRGAEEARRLALEPGRPVILVGRDNHRYEWVRDLVDRARLGPAPALAVDMGWPSGDRAYADIATFGASRAVGEALRGLLEKEGAL